jgi:hypothetical protein
LVLPEDFGKPVLSMAGKGNPPHFPPYEAKTPDSLDRAIDALVEGAGSAAATSLSKRRFFDFWRAIGRS